MTKEKIKGNIEKVNDYWIKSTPEPGNCAWERACYMSGALDAYRATGKKEYLDFVTNWANANGWAFYDDENNNTTNADYLLCGESYLDLIDEFGVCGTFENMSRTLEWTVNDPNNDYWWWVDTFYMALNFYNRIGVRQKDGRFFDKAYRLYINSKEERRCFNEKYSLWYRDESFLPDKKLNADGKEIFWSRGNGWVFAGLAKTLETLPENNRYYGEYRQVFARMAERIKKLQTGDGFWHTDLLSPKLFDMPEVSGTVLFAFGLLKGINNNILGKEYLDCAVRAYNAITDVAIDENGRIGWVQTVAWDPGVVKKENTNDYAVGTYLKASYEFLKLMDK